MSEQLQIDSIRTDGGTQARVQIDWKYRGGVATPAPAHNRRGVDIAIGPRVRTESVSVVFNQRPRFWTSSRRAIVREFIVRNVTA